MGSAPISKSFKQDPEIRSGQLQQTQADTHTYKERGKKKYRGGEEVLWKKKEMRTREDYCNKVHHNV